MFDMVSSSCIASCLRFVAKVGIWWCIVEPCVRGASDRRFMWCNIVFPHHICHLTFHLLLILPLHPLLDLNAINFELNFWCFQNQAMFESNLNYEEMDSHLSVKGEYTAVHYLVCVIPLRLLESWVNILSVFYPIYKKENNFLTYKNWSKNLMV